jgi:hypothetical protein
MCRDHISGGLDCFLPHPVQCIVHELSYHFHVFITVLKGTSPRSCVTFRIFFYDSTQLKLEGRPLSTVRHCLGQFSTNIFSNFPRLKAISPIRNIRRRHAIPTPKNNSQFYPTSNFPTPTVSHKMSLYSHDKFRQLQIHFPKVSHILNLNY